MAPFPPAGSDHPPGRRFLTDSAPAGKRLHPAFNGMTLSLLLHGGALILVSLAIARPLSSPGAAPKAQAPVHLVFVPVAGGGGERAGDGGGNRSPKPVRRIELVGRAALAMPSPKPLQPQPAASPQPLEPTPIVVPAPRVEAGLRDAIGAIADLRPVGLDDRGSGTGPGADGDKGAGIGRNGRGGLGDKDGTGLDGEDGLLPGNGVTWPRLVREVKPNYTPDAMRAQVQGLVALEIVVLADGSVGRVNVVRSLDSRFGLDAEAIKAVRGWRFDPGRRLGKAIPVRVGVELSFTLR
jgi:protein TonB